MNSRPRVSVLTVTYNQERYIEQTVHSALMQNTDFDYEIVIGEDCSTDRTRDILLRLEAEHPSRLRLLLRNRNLGGLNFRETFSACTGEYIAWLDGDDYWTDPCKLARQVAFLDEHPQFAGCAHVVRQLGEHADHGLFPNPCPAEFTFDELLAENRFATCSVMYRRRLDSFPSWFQHCTMGDWPLHILHAVHGPFKVFPEVMGVYRIHEGGVWSLARRTWRLRQSIDLYRHLCVQFPEHRRLLDRCKFRWQYELGHELTSQKDLRAARDVVRAMFPVLGRVGLVGMAQFLDLSFRVLCPPLYGFLARPPTAENAVPTLPGAARRQAIHQAARVAMRSKSRLARVPAVAGELLAGRYARFGLGPLGIFSAAADLLL